MAISEAEEVVRGGPKRSANRKKTPSIWRAVVGGGLALSCLVLDKCRPHLLDTLVSLAELCGPEMMQPLHHPAVDSQRNDQHNDPGECRHLGT